MTELSYSPAFNTYALFVVALCLLLFFVDSFSGVIRGKTKSALNAEDSVVKKNGGTLVESDPAEVARVMRAHRNALANIVPFLLLMLMYVIQGASQQHVLWVCGAFTAARLVHAIAYIRAIQPLRSIAYGLGQLGTVAVAIRVVLAALHMI